MHNDTSAPFRAVDLGIRSPSVVALSHSPQSYQDIPCPSGKVFYARIVSAEMLVPLRMAGVRRSNFHGMSNDSANRADLQIEGR